ncbi:hypothetical protein D910_11184 [Dendroctonus ponderosae]|uniref:Uncharacterized protein n=1 Tax=Dendroctonus ponderosae TaxID=77166 RepID=U4UN63_DENPD|nr:hypothetical protein D910_11184 [Dendroctonus ponderosae]
MEVMEDGNLMDKVTVLIQRDMEYYKANQSVLQETVCPGIIGGRFDFPRSASFAAIKLAVWWEDEFIAAYRKPSGFFQKSLMEGARDNSEASGGCGGIVRSSDPAKFISTIGKSADQLLKHLHVLTQEALDHADLTVLTGTIGATALLKNCLRFYIQILSDVKSPSIEPLRTGYKKYNEMCEALAERLLDLHCRLLSLYIIQDADCLDWENDKPFFESERGSYIIQMWWLYMQGTKEDLWNTVPPKMAQRVFAGMLNESLTILTVRYSQCLPSEARTELLLVDISNLLFCVAQLLPSICDTVQDLTGSGQITKSKMLRDVHVKCQQLYCCFLLRGTSLDTLHKIFKKGTDNLNLLNPKGAAPTPWIIFALPNIFKDGNISLNRLTEVEECSTLGMELMVLLAQPQANWALLLKVLCSKKFKVLRILLNEFMERSNQELRKTPLKAEDCGNLLCSGDGTCKNMDITSSTLTPNHYYELIMSASQVLLHVGNEEELKEYFVEVVMRHSNWAKCFERRNVWNQIRPAWYEAILNIVFPILPVVEETVINALQTGATMYQAMSLIVACFSQFWDMLDPSLTKISYILQEVIPSDITPISNSVLMQTLMSALYSSLIMVPEKLSLKKEVTFHLSEGAKPGNLETKLSERPFNSAGSAKSAALAAAEHLCSIGTRLGS